MATRYYSFAEGEYYHLYNRGNSKQPIFKSARDYDRFIVALHLSNSPEPFKLKDFKDIDVLSLRQTEPLVYIGAYCLMPNHFHLLLTPATKDGIPKFMLRLGTSYATYFNKRHFRTGALFEGSYKAKYAESDRYLKYLFSYIHLNPFRDKEGKVKRTFTVGSLTEYQYSSLPDYLGIERKQSMVITPNRFPQYFITTKDHWRELFDWLDFQDS
jgi:putative transposase